VFASESEKPIVVNKLQEHRIRYPQIHLQSRRDARDQIVLAAGAAAAVLSRREFSAIFASGRDLP
jgi:hypothetical protein